MDPPCNLMHLNGDDFLQYYSGKSGVYFISYEYDETRPILLKIGLSKYRREDVAKPQPTYWMRSSSSSSSSRPRRREEPDEPEEPAEEKVIADSLSGLGKRIYDYMLCYPKGFYIYAIVETSSSRVTELENSIHQYLVSKNLHSDLPHSKSEEWFYLHVHNLPSIVRMFTKANNLDRYCIFDPYYKLAELPKKRQAFRRITKPMTPRRKKQIESHSKSIIETIEKPRAHLVVDRNDDEGENVIVRKRRIDFE